MTPREAGEPRVNISREEFNAILAKKDADIRALQIELQVSEMFRTDYLTKLELMEGSGGSGDADLWAELKRQRDQLAVENAELRRDAERYRWLRENAHSWSSGAQILVDVITRYRSPAESIDAAIDAALAAQK